MKRFVPFFCWVLGLSVVGDGQRVVLFMKGCFGNWIRAISSQFFILKETNSACGALEQQQQKKDVETLPKRVDISGS